MSESEIVLYPTGTCFDDAVDYLNDLCSKEPWKIKWLNKQYKIVHGICLLEDGSPYSHCWLERANRCYDFRLYGSSIKEKVMVEYTRIEYYSRFKPQKMLKYSLKDCCDLERTYGYPGPWDAELRKLCNDLVH